MSKKGNEIAQALYDKIERDGVPDTTDWQHYRIQASIEFAAQILANHGGTPASVANNAVDYADALIAELKKGGQDDNNH